MPALVVAGSGTDIGKTHVSAALLTALHKAGRPVEAFKPVASGVDEDDYAGSDQTVGTLANLWLGQDRFGAIETAGDTDWLRLASLSMGLNYNFNLAAIGTGGRSIPSSFRRSASSPSSVGALLLRNL